MVSRSSLFLLLVACGDPVPEGGALFAEGEDDRLVFVGEPLTFSAEESPGARSYRWTSDGETAEGAEVDLTFETPGRRQVYLEVFRRRWPR
jgi:hypothetical protein